MTQQKSNTAFLVFLVIALVLSILFTWKALEAKNPVEQSAQGNSQASTNNLQYQQTPLQTIGQVGINLVKPAQTKGAQ